MCQTNVSCELKTYKKKFRPTRQPDEKRCKNIRGGVHLNFEKEKTDIVTLTKNVFM